LTRVDNSGTISLTLRVQFSPLVPEFDMRVRSLLTRLTDAANSLFPSPRLFVLLGGGAVLIGLSPVWWPLLTLGLAVDVLTLALATVDYRLLRQARHCHATRSHDDVFSLGVRNRVQVSVRNRADIPFHVELGDEYPPEFSSTAERFRFRLEPEAVHRIAYYLTPDKRGNYTFGRLVVRLLTNLGLLCRQRFFSSDSPAVAVYPNLQDVRKYDLLGRRNRLEQMGLRRLRIRGRSLEFDSLRDYVVGDELRHIHWKASAKRGKLVTKEFDIERSQHVMIALDLGRTMASRLDNLTKLDHAINACLLLTHVASFSDDHVGVMGFADEIVGYLPPTKGRRQTGRVAEFLYPLESRLTESDYRRAFLYLGQLCRRRTLIIVLTDLLDPDSSAQLIRNLPPLTRRHLVLCVAFSDYELDQLLAVPPRKPRDLFEQAVAVNLRHDRSLALAALRSRGVLTLDAAPSDLSIAVVNRYLALKQEALI